MNMSEPFADTPNIELNTDWYGNLGNRLYQFFAVSGLIRHLGKGTISNADFSDWGFIHSKADRSRYKKHILINTIEEFDFDRIRSITEDEPSTFIEIRSHLQQQSLFLDRSYYTEKLPRATSLDRVPGSGVAE